MKPIYQHLFLLSCFALAISALGIVANLEQIQHTLINTDNIILYDDNQYIIYTDPLKATINKFNKQTNLTKTVKTPKGDCPNIQTALLKGIEGKVYCLDQQDNKLVINEIDIRNSFKANYTLTIKNAWAVSYETRESEKNFISGGYLFLSIDNLHVYDLISNQFVCLMPSSSLPSDSFDQSIFNSKGIYFYTRKIDQINVYFYSCQQKKFFDTQLEGKDFGGVHSFYNADKLMIDFAESQYYEKKGFALLEFIDGEIKHTYSSDYINGVFTKLNESTYGVSNSTSNHTNFLINSIRKDELNWDLLGKFDKSIADMKVQALSLYDGVVSMNFGGRYANYDIQHNILSYIENTDAFIYFKNGSLITSYTYGYIIDTPQSIQTDIVIYGEFDKYVFHIKDSNSSHNALYGLNFYGGYFLSFIRFDGDSNKVSKAEIEIEDSVENGNAIIEDVQQNQDGTYNVIYCSHFNNIYAVLNNGDKIIKIQDNKIAKFKQQKVFSNYEDNLIYVVEQLDIQAKLVTYSLNDSSIVNSTNIGLSLGTLIQKIDNDILMTVSLNLAQQQYQIKFYDVKTAQILQQYQLGHVLDVSTTQIPIPVDYQKTSDGKFSVNGFIVQHVQGGVSLYNTKGDSISLYDQKVSNVIVEGPSKISLTAGDYMGTGAKLTYKVNFEDKLGGEEDEIKIKFDKFLEIY